MNLEKLKSDLRSEEGYRDTVYLDSMIPPNATIGIGHLVKPSDNFVQGKRYKRKVIEKIFDYDVKICVQDAYNLCKDLDIKEEAVLIIAHMCFQLGRTKTAKFKKMFEALAKKDYVTAGFEMEDSLWRKKHTPARAMRLSEQMKKLI
jgi:GH24 family phage-related lysozyme (muramidase)